MLTELPRNITALVAVKNKACRTAITRSLEELPGSDRIVSCSTAESACNLLDDDGPFDIVIIDEALPDQDGLALCKYLLEKTFNSRLLFVTEQGNERVAADAMTAGADLFIIMDKDMGFLMLLPSVLNTLLRAKPIRPTADIPAKPERVPTMADQERRINALREANRSLKTLLSNRSRDKKVLEDKISANIQRLVIPYVKKLNETELDDRQKMYLNLVHENLNEIVAPFLNQLSSRHTDLTATEIKVAWLIKEGRTTTDIARILASSKGAVNFHRNNIRKKTGLRNKKINLRTYLQNFS